ncbi:aminoglycoside 3-N-acetyltransferase [Paracoccus sp. MC1862]|uniref:aminoglycoside 3-N-acetyltransferase n=1 Tax=Paracoccus sp. MC1862 TaxID=2760307 RepID=UPI0015FEC2B4|nr:aminoglycoside 3-N-acetyltransferase [Paracoccus sp. MC1862]MBB1499404.1 aminoglycoside 3-N-acetyltransferase [Paracoccus sp. MC1862]QQO45362.1 aminoglycoside 3-N-acetyltransferase [Paracoccus sp. MC1862]
MADRASVARELGALGVAQGDVLMVHASLKALGPVEGGPAAVVGALMDAVGPGGTIMGYASWDRSPYEETLNGARMDAAARRGWPAFDPATAGVYPGFGLLNRFIAETPGARRSAHPDASMVALGAGARELVAPHRLGQAFGPGSPVERFIRMGGRVLMLGAPLDAVTALHYAEAVADIPGKRRVSYEMPLRRPDGRTVWQHCEDFDSNGILDCFAPESGPDGVETIARAYAALDRHREGMVAGARCHLFDAGDIVAFGVGWLEARFGCGG